MYVFLLLVLFLHSEASEHVGATFSFAMNALKRHTDLYDGIQIPRYIDFLRATGQHDDIVGSLLSVIAVAVAQGVGGCDVKGDGLQTSIAEGIGCALGCDEHSKEVASILFYPQRHSHIATCDFLLIQRLKEGIVEAYLQGLCRLRSSVQIDV